MNKQSLAVTSTDGIHSLYANLYWPEGEPKAVFQLVHGMCEYQERYLGLFELLTDAGYLCVAHDHLGHGHTAVNDSELGFIAPKEGWKRLVEDVQQVYNALPASYQTLPHLVLGHSMGSFVARLYATAYPTALQGLMLMGTGGPNPLCGLGLTLSAAVSRLCGPRHISKGLVYAAFGPYVSHFREKDKYCWISTQKETTEAYARDKYCTYLFTASAMHDLATLNKTCNNDAWFDAFPKQLPTLFLSGSDDPVGDYGKGVRQVYDRLKDRGLTTVDCRIYTGARHEVLNDFCRNDVTADILTFCEKALH